MNTTQLLLGVLFSSIGLGYFLYGRKQKNMVPVLCGLLLIVYSYFIDSLFGLAAIGVLFSTLPYFIRV
jgi:hypothetical protein